MITLDWFAELVARMSRQTLTTMGKRVGLKPFRRQGIWRFRNTRLLDGEPGAYGPHSIAIWELRMVREPEVT